MQDIKTQQDVDIYTPLAYFAYFQYPLTAFEIWKWQFKPGTRLSYADIEGRLRTSRWLQERVSCHQGAWAIGSPEQVREQVEERKRRYVDAVYKERRLRPYLCYLQNLRGVRGVALCNAMPFHFTRPTSDIDLFILTKAGALWSTRFQVVAPLIALKQRPGERDQDPIDASFFLSDAQLNIAHLQKDDDPYFAFWIATLTPVLGSQNLWNRFFAENHWAFKCLPNTRPPQRSFAYRRRSMHAWVPTFPENFMRTLQHRRLPNDLYDKANTDTCVVLNEQVLKFHRVDRRDEVAQAFKQQMQICH